MIACADTTTPATAVPTIPTAMDRLVDLMTPPHTDVCTCPGRAGADECVKGGGMSSVVGDRLATQARQRLGNRNEIVTIDGLHRCRPLGVNGIRVSGAGDAACDRRYGVTVTT